MTSWPPSSQVNTIIIIDYMIALEALLLQEQQELAYKLALRGTALLGENPDSRLEVFSRLRKAYSVRSKIVHGDAPPAHVSLGSTHIPFYQFVEEIASDTRNAIRKLLALTESAQGFDIIMALDESIARGNQP
jgi:hypothetical protein